MNSPVNNRSSDQTYKLVKYLDLSNFHRATRDILGYC